MEMSPDLIWYIVGGILLAIEFTLAPAMGFLFVGLGALITGLALSTGVVESNAMQWVVFGASSVIWAAFLWKPMKNWRNDHKKTFSNIHGEKVEVVGELIVGKTGKAKWSGVEMKARLAEGAQAMADGDEAEIVSMDGNILIVK